jgi:ABC-2 type transport system ATP-binding protein
MPTCIQTTDLTKSFRAVTAVDHLNLDIQQGEVFGLLGPNGAGKSTTLSLLTGLLPSTMGSVTIFGKDLRQNFLELIGRMGVLVEQPAFYDHLSARQNLQLLARLSGREVNLDRSLDRAGLLGVAHRKVGTYSQGMRQRLALAQAMLTEPELLILDEPTNGLDLESAQETLHLFRRIADEANVTIVLASHMLHEVELVCDRVAILSDGKLLRCDPVDTVLSYDGSHVEVLIDAPEAAARRLIEEDWVAEAQHHPGRIQVHLDGGTVHQLTAFLVGSGYRISGVIPKRRNLQEYFLKVTNS